jgi:glycosyltransferase involved in cell wall biosynthesis
VAHSPVARPYVLITAARDAGQSIERTIASVALQTRPPAAWAVVSDGSSDRTDEIVGRHLDQLSWLRLVRIDRSGSANFAAKARALERAYATVVDTPHGAVGNLDADVVVPPEYFERCTGALAEDGALGITGGRVVEVIGGRRRIQRSAATSVAGAVQCFRRPCWEAVGSGYLPLEGGGEDAVAEVLARSAGYTVRCLEDLEVLHDGPVVSGSRSTLGARRARGVTNWRLGYHPLFQIAGAVSRLNEPPALLGSVATLAGYGGAAIRRTPRTPPPEVVDRLRREQTTRLRAALGGWRAPRSAGC